MQELEENVPLISAPVRSFMQKLLISVCGLALIAAGVALSLLLVTANPSDPTFNTASGEMVHNWLGSIGAQIAASLFELMKFAAFMLCVPLFSWGFLLLRQKLMTRWKLRIVALGLGLMLMTTAIALLAADSIAVPPAGILGLWGAAAAQYLLSFLPPADWLNIQMIAGIGAGITGTALYLWASGIKLGRAGALAGFIVMKMATPFAKGASLMKSQLLRRSRQTELQEQNIEQRETPASAQIAKTAKAKKKKPASRRMEPQLSAENAAPKQVQEQFDFHSSEFKLPPLKLLKTPPKQAQGPAQALLDEHAQELTQVLGDFRIQGSIEEVRYGPVVTRYGLNPAPGTKSQRVIALADDIARSMAVMSVRVAVVPGQNIIGIELPNDTREMVLLRHILDDPKWQAFDGGLPVALGKDIAGEPVIADLAKMPHLLVAGTTGSGKSVGVNGMILSLLYRYSPEQCRLIMIDPKMLELSVYDGIPHLLSPVVTEPAKAVMALKWTVREMENRYRNMAKLGVRNIGGYNERLAEARAKGEVLTRRVQTGFDPETGKPVYEEDRLDLAPLPFIVVIIDEVADLMLVAGKEIEAAVQRLAQMARAAGIHVIMATQRPSVDVITGTIKANFPTRISFQVTSRIDSRTILGEQGAEQLLGKGDMLYMEGGGRVTRIHGPFVDDREVEEVAHFLRAQGEPEYNQSVTEEAEEEAETDSGNAGTSGVQATGNSLYDDAVALVIREQKASTSFVQRHLKIGYNRAATLIEEMESAGIISAANHVGKRDVLIQPDEG